VSDRFDTSELRPSAATTIAASAAVRWNRVIGYVVSVFAISWGLGYLFDALATTGGRGRLIPPLGMFVPALVAVCLRLFVDRDSGIHVKEYGGRPGWILKSFLVVVGIQLVSAVLAVATPAPAWIVGGIASWSMIGWTLLFIKLYRSHGEADFDRIGLGLGRVSIGVRIALAFVAFLILQGLLDLAAGTGPSILGTIPGVDVPIPEGTEPVILVITFVLVIVGTPLGNLAMLFGEEYGWRGFLQDELEPIGRRRSALLIGLLWGVWHIPIILSGVHTYPPTLQGFAVGFAFFSLWGFVQSYAVWKTGSVWTAAVLHGIVNGLYYFIRTFVVRPDDKILSFGLGLYGLVCLGVVTLLIWRDPVWSASRVSRRGGGDDPGDR
jgi:membrane protease YdiL (CAAX protease family)